MAGGIGMNGWHICCALSSKVMSGLFTLTFEGTDLMKTKDVRNWRTYLFLVHALEGLTLGACFLPPSLVLRSTFTKDKGEP